MKLGNVLARRGRLAAYKLVLVQAAVASIISTLFFVMWGAQYGLSALAGCCTS